MTRGLALALALLFCCDAAAGSRAWLNQYGHTGLMQTPTARAPGKGALGGGIGYFSPYRSLFFHAQPLDWVQGNFRWVEVSNRDYSFVMEIDGEEQDVVVGRRFTDKGVDLQFRLLRESDRLPELAVGFIDIGGTGLFASEYLVASKRFFDFDVHLGIGWGRLGSADDFDNPLTVISDRFEERDFRRDNPGGQLQTSTYFRGDTALFGGVVWTPRGGPLSLIAEFEGNDYQSEPLDNPQKASMRLNLGAHYRVLPGVDVGVGWQRGNLFTASLALQGNLETATGPEKVQRPPVSNVPPFGVYQSMGFEAPLTPTVVERIRRDLSGQGIRLHAADADDTRKVVTVWVSQALSTSLPLTGGRAARALLRQTGTAYDYYEVVEVIGGIESARMRFPRVAFHQAAAGDWTAEEFAEFVDYAPARRTGYRAAAYRGLLRYPAFSWAVNPQVRTNLGGADAFFVGQLMARFAATMQLSARWSMTGAMGVNIMDNIGDRLGQTFPSGLPRVRSDTGKYLREGTDAYLAQLETNYLFPVADDVYGRLSAGIFEEMYGGVGGEILYRPAGRRWAVGVDVAHVWQREFEQRFGFQDYNVTTGHVTWYHELPWENLRLVLSYGRYLARDHGATIDISRRFGSGVRFGVFATLTNVSSETFGEGSFDKGFYVSVPFDLFSARGGSGHTSFQFRPLTRDGGQKVRSGRALYGDFDTSHARTLDTADPRDWLR